MTASAQALTADLAPVVAPMGLLVEDITVMPAGKRRLVRVLVDRQLSLEAPITDPTDPVTLDEIADATRAISDELDASNAMGEQPYVLEVSSPGTDRPLTEPRHFARNVGRLVTLTLQKDDAKVAGRIMSADADGVDVAPEQGGKKPGPAGEPARINYTEITSAKVQVEFTRANDAAGEDD